MRHAWILASLVASGVLAAQAPRLTLAARIPVSAPEKQAVAIAPNGAFAAILDADGFVEIAMTGSGHVGGETWFGDLAPAGRLVVFGVGSRVAVFDADGSDHARWAGSLDGIPVDPADVPRPPDLTPGSAIEPAAADLLAKVGVAPDTLQEARAARWSPAAVGLLRNGSVVLAQRKRSFPLRAPASFERAVCLTADGQAVVVARGGGLLVCRVADGARHVVPAVLGRDAHLASGGIGSELLAVDRARCAVWNLTLGRPLRGVALTAPPIHDGSFVRGARDERYVLAWSRHAVHRVSLEDGLTERLFALGEVEVRTVAAQLGADGTLAVGWNPTGPVGRLRIERPDRPARELEIDLPVLDLDLCPGGRAVVTTGRAGTSVIDTRTGQIVGDETTARTAVVAVSDELAFVAGADHVELLTLPELESLDRVEVPLEKRELSALPVTTSADRRRLAVSNGVTVFVFDVAGIDPRARRDRR